MKNKCLVFLYVFLFSKIITDIRTKYIPKCTILSKNGIFINENFSNLSEPARLRYNINRATIIDNIFFFTIIIFGANLIKRVVF